MSVQVPKGYKQTEVGVIPEDWNNFSIGDLISFQGGSQPDKSFFSYSKKSGYIRLIQIRDYKTDKFEVFVPKNLVRRFCDKNDIMIGRYGPPVFQILRGISGAYNVALIKATPSESINKEYAYYYLKQDSLFNFIDKLSQRSSGQTGVDLKELRAYPFVFPAQASEQAAIVEALSDADALIESLEQMIAKKRQIKQGAMQELLTGQRRLPEFNGEWDPVTLGQLGKCLRGVSYKGSSDLFDHDNDQSKRLLRSNNVQSSSIDEADIQFVNANCVSNDQILKNNDILICMANGSKDLVGKSALFNLDDGFEYTFGAFMGCLRVFHDLAESKFVSYLMQTSSYRTQINNLLAGSSINNLTPASIESLEFLVPSKDEQIAISLIIGEMDKEIEGLNARLMQSRKIKQAMMQELLTGRIRLI